MMTPTLRRARREGLLAGLACLLVCSGALCIVHLETRAVLRDGLRVRLENLAAVAAIQMDATLHDQVIEPGQLGNALYGRATAPLLRLCEAVPEVFYAYTVRGPAEAPAFVLDATVYLPKPGDETPAAQPGEVYHEAPEALRIALRERRLVSSEEPYSDKWGTFLSAFAPFLDSQGKLSGVVGVDLSLADFERRMRPLDFALGAAWIVGATASGAVGIWRARTRHRQLQAEAELVRAREAAESADRAKGAFLAMMSHEIRTPLNGVLGMAEVLAGSNLTPAQAEQIRVIRSSAGTLMGVLNDVLDFSKIQAGSLAFNVAPIAARPPAEETVALHAANARHCGLSLAVQVLPAAPECVNADDGRLRQILGNLLSNAVKFTEHGSITLRLGPAQLADGRSAIEFAVLDTGAGIAPEALARLFAPFSQVDDSLARRQGGTGLGLAISRRLAELQGGTLTVESEPGRGSCFRLLLPAAPPPLAPTQPATATPDQDEPTKGERPLRVLVAEDQEINRKVIELLLSRLNQPVAFAYDGAAAVARWRELQPDVILMDVQMPGVDGREATRRIRDEIARTRPSTVDPWIVAVSAAALQEEQTAALAAGMNDFVAKPVSAAALRDALARARAALAQARG